MTVTPVRELQRFSSGTDLIALFHPVKNDGDAGFFIIDVPFIIVEDQLSGTAVIEPALHQLGGEADALVGLLPCAGEILIDDINIDSTIFSNIYFKVTVKVMGSFFVSFPFADKVVLVLVLFF